MRFLTIALPALLLQGCAAVYSLSPPVDKEPFQAKGKSVAVQYAMADRSAADGCVSNVVFVFNSCRSGAPEERAEELVQVLNGYGFDAWRDGARADAKPDYTIAVNEMATNKDEDTKVMGLSMISSFTLGVFPVLSDARPAQVTYTLFRNGARGGSQKLHSQTGTTRVKTLGGIYFMVLGPANYGANKESLLTEHERALQNWIQGGLFE